MYICIYIYIIHVYVYDTCTHTHEYIYIYTYICIYIYIYISYLCIYQQKWMNSIPGVMIKIPSVECRSQLGLCYSAPKRYRFGGRFFNGHDEKEPMDWRYLPYIRPIFQGYVREYPQKIWPNMRYSTSILGSWSCH